MITPRVADTLKRLRLLLTALVAAGLCLPAIVRADEPDISRQAWKILKDHCYQCHGVTQKVPGLLILERDTLVASRGEGRDPYLAPGDLEHSVIWEMIDNGSMPPDGMEESDAAILKQWIEAGGEFPLVSEDERPYISDQEVMRLIARHLFDENSDDRKFQRYFTIHHLHNNRAITDVELRLYRAAFSKVVNNLSRQPAIVVPEAIDDQQAVFNIDLRSVGWQNLDVWDEVVRAYPYGLKPQSIEEIEEYNKLEELFGPVNFDGMPYIRADWFVVTASRPPLYHTLVQTPNTLDELLTRLGIDLKENLKIGQSKRGGVFESGVSAQNRLIEYHPSNNGAFWLSYDFFKNAGRSNLARFPLGPKGADGKALLPELDEFAFEHAGGEIIYNLPNGLNGYMLVTEKGARIDSGPISIVWDSTQTSGNPEIVNGISCMNCHKHGTIKFEDNIRDGVAIFNAPAQKKVQELYVTKDEMNRLLDQAGSDYLRKLDQAIGGFLKQGEDVTKDITSFAEPVSFVARRYDSNVSLEAAARELGFSEPEQLRNRLGGKRLIQLGLGPLVNSGGTIKRSFWDSRESGISVFQEAASELARGTPVP